MWLILDAEPGAVPGQSVRREVGCDELYKAMLDGHIEELLGWEPVERGNVF